MAFAFKQESRGRKEAYKRMISERENKGETWSEYSEKNFLEKSWIYR